MKKRRFLKPKDDYIYFKDKMDDSKIYCMTRESNDNVKKILNDQNRNFQDAGPDLKVKAYPLNKVDEDRSLEYYDIKVSEPVDFFVNRIEFIITSSNSRS